MKLKTLIVFDIDGTLTDSVEIHQTAFSEMLVEIGVAKMYKGFKSFKHHTDSYIAKEIYENDLSKPFSNEKVNEFEKGLNKKINAKNINEILGAKELIQKLKKDKDYGICYATGSLRRPAEYKLKSIGIEFDKKQLVASDDLFERENIVKKAIENAKSYYKVEKFDRIISVGDGLWDLLTAENLEIEFIGVGLKNKEVLFENGAKVVFENLLNFNIQNKTINEL